MSYTFAIGDVHGCLDMLVALVRKIEASRPSGKIVFLGDYVDRGPNSRGVLDFIISGPQRLGWEWIALKGNHEDMMVGAYSGKSEASWWIGNGGAETLVSFGAVVPTKTLQWCERLPMIHIDEHRIFVHAGVDEGRPIDDQMERDLLWSRKPPHYSGDYWGKHLCHGHTPATSNPTTIGNRTNIDSGAVFGGKLTCAVFADDMPGAPVEFIQVRSAA